MMEDPSDEKSAMREPLIPNSIPEEEVAGCDLVGSSSAQDLLIMKPNSAKGGFRTMPFIFANEAFLDVANYGVMPNMIIYLVKKYGMETADATQILFLWSATVYLFPTLCALIADSYIGKFWMIAFGCLINILGMVLLWLSAMIPQATPCHENVCAPQTLSQLSLLYASLFLISIGSGGIRSCTAAFGADQLATVTHKCGIKLLEKYFSWFYLFSSMAIMVGMTVVVYIQETWGWRIGFGVAALLALLSAVSFFLGAPLCIRLKGKAGLLTRLAQVLVACYRKRHIKLSSHTSHLRYHHSKGSRQIHPSDNLRILNRACVIEKHERDLVTDEEVVNPWSLCTVEQVEELKSLIRVIPLWSSGIVCGMTVTQTTFVTLQALSMDRYVTRSFEIPAASLYMISLVSLVLWIAVYDRALVPLASKAVGKPVHLCTRQRMGIGHVIAFLSMVVAAVVERYRRNMSITETQLTGQHPQSAFPVSALWLAPQYVLMGVANALSAVAQTQFYYSELPKTMSSLVSTLFTVGLSAGSLASSFLVSFIDSATKSRGSWVSNDIYAAHYDYYYWLLAGLNAVNFAYFLVCCRAYGPDKEPAELIPAEVDKIIGAQDP